MTCPAPRHDATGYQAHGCRCPEGKEAQRLYKKRWSVARSRGVERKVDATGTKRRIRALMRIGWSSHDLMERMGYSNAGTWLLYADRLNVTTVERVRALYDELWDKPGPSKWTRTWATNQGFPPPMAWDEEAIDDITATPPCHEIFENVPSITQVVDPIAVERFIGGDLPWDRLSTKERLEAALRMDRAGISRTTIAERTHLNTRTLWDALRAGSPSESGETIAS